MNVDYKDHYNSEYWTSRKTYRTADGKEHVYHGPGLEWEGFQLVVEALKPLLPGKTLLDIGCGGGDLARRFQGAGYDAYGVDISEHAIKNAKNDMQWKLALADITTCPETLVSYYSTPSTTGHIRNVFPDKFDAVIATDLLEHIYLEDLDKTFNWMMGKSNRWLFFCVATAQHPTSPFYKDDKMEFVHKKGEPIPLEWEATAVSGHVNVRHFSWWLKYFKTTGLTIRYDLTYMFQINREMHEQWKNTGGWNMQTTWILEKK